jgi:hypothetical protein
MENWVDDLARALARDGSRRTVLKVLGATAAGGMLALLGGGRTEAAPKKCREAGHSCEDGQECCSGLCLEGTGPGGARRCAGVACLPVGSSCTSSAECCAGSTCVKAGLEATGLCFASPS